MRPAESSTIPEATVTLESAARPLHAGEDERAIGKRVLYVAYTDPAGYPPLHHSARMLADAGCTVLTLGIRVPEVTALEFPTHQRIHAKYFPASQEGWRQKLHYFGFCAWVFGWTVCTRPRWIYASDPLSGPAALLASFVPGVSVIYHEHDSPVMAGAQRRSFFARVISWTRRRLALRASLCVLPQQDRADLFRSTLRVRDIACVWNCPSRGEVSAPPTEREDQTLKLVYQGSIVADRLPISIAHALQRLPTGVTLHVIGYTTRERRGYDAEFLQICEQLGLGDRVHFYGPMERRRLLELCRKFDVGLSLIRQRTNDVNMHLMAGASNKPFDYLACGLPLIVTENPMWRTLYVEAGYGLACDPESPASIADTIRWYLEHPRERFAMGAAGRRRINTDWNYEKQFEPVLCHILQSRSGQSRRASEMPGSP